jgi:hypothetical protein
VNYSDQNAPQSIVTLKDYVMQAQEAEGWSMEPLTKAGQVCYTITTGMSLRDFKDGLGQAYWNRDRETLDRLLESLQEGA